ncbi:hypothetical protein D3C84_1232960 [compost metagenome]
MQLRCVDDFLTSEATGVVEVLDVDSDQVFVGAVIERFLNDFAITSVITDRNHSFI